MEKSADITTYSAQLSQKMIFYGIPSEYRYILAIVQIGLVFPSGNLIFFVLNQLLKKEDIQR